MDKETKLKYLEQKKKLKIQETTDLLLEAKKMLREKKKKIEEYDRNGKLRALRELNGITKETHFYEIVDKFIKGTPTSILAIEYGYPEYKLKEMINQHHDQLVNARAANALSITSKTGFNPVLEKLKTLETLNQEFLDCLSEDYSETLSEEEALFCWLYVHKGDSIEAIESANLNTGLIKNQSPTYKRAVVTRSLYLQNKPNVAAYIKELREKKYYVEDVSKKEIQLLLLEQIEQTKLRGDSREASNLRQLIELLGKTVGAFTERLEIHEVDPNQALDKLIEMAKNSSSDTYEAKLYK